MLYLSQLLVQPGAGLPQPLQGTLANVDLLPVAAGAGGQHAAAGGRVHLHKSRHDFDLEGEVLDAMQMMLLSSGAGDQYATGCRGPPCSKFYAHSSRLMLHPKQGSRVVTSLSPVQAIVLTRRERIK